MAVYRNLNNELKKRCCFIANNVFIIHSLGLLVRSQPSCTNHSLSQDGCVHIRLNEYGMELQVCCSLKLALANSY